MVVVRPMGKTSDEITRKAGNEMRQVRAHTKAPDTSHKLKSLQDARCKDLSIRVNSKVTEEVMYQPGLWVDGGLHLRLHVCKVIHLLLESSDSFYRTLSLVSPITGVLLQGSVPVEVPGKGGGSSSEARLWVIMRGVVTTTLMLTRVATPIPSVPPTLLRMSLRCSHGLLCCLRASLPTIVRWSYEAVVHLFHLIKLQCKTFTRIQSKGRVR
jgi:hypothetical protein